MTKKIAGMELTDVKVRRVSIVDKAAIRQPFKIMKREQQLDASTTQTQKAETALMSGTLNKLFSGLFKSATPPAVSKLTAVIVNKTADQEKAKLRMKAAGFEHGEGVENENAVVYTRAGETEIDPNKIDGIVVKSDGDTALVVSNVRKSLFGSDPDDVPSTFADRVASDCVLPGISSAMDTLSYTMWNALYDSQTAADAAAAVDAAFTSAAGYIKALIATIPQEAFKMEVVKAEGGKLTLQWAPDGTTIYFPMGSNAESATSRASTATTNGGSGITDGDNSTDIPALKVRKDAEGGTPEGDADKKADPELRFEATKNDMPVLKSAKKPAEEMTDAEKKKQKQKDKEKDVEDQKPAKDAKKADEPTTVSKNDLEGLAKMFGDKIDAGFSGIKKQVAGLTDSVDDLQQRVAKSEQEQVRIKAAVRGSIGKSEPAADERTKQRRSDDDNDGIGLIDTAYNRNI